MAAGPVRYAPSGRHQVSAPLRRRHPPSSKEVGRPAAAIENGAGDGRGARRRRRRYYAAGRETERVGPCTCQVLAVPRKRGVPPTARERKARFSACFRHRPEKSPFLLPRVKVVYQGMARGIPGPRPGAGEIGRDPSSKRRIGAYPTPREARGMVGSRRPAVSSGITSIQLFGVLQIRCQ